MVDAETALGRSTVIDLQTKAPNKFRQIDHRSIVYVILRNVKYVFKKGGKKVADGDEDDEMDGDAKKKPD